jgi:tetratricopeptide (TPR) repeat protein
MINANSHIKSPAGGPEFIANSNCEPAVHSIEKGSILFLFLFALIFRMIYVVQSTDNPLFGVPLVDAYSYVQWAEKMVDGIWLWDHVGNYLPIYPAFLAVQKIIFGSDPFVNKILQSVMGALSAVLMAQAAARTWGRQVGIITGYLIATNWMLVIFGTEAFAETFSIFFLSMTLWLLIMYPSRVWAILAAGFTCAISAGVRANLFLVLPCILGWLIWKNWIERTIAFKAAIFFSCGTVLIIGPIVIRNFQLTGVPMLRAQATWSLYSGLAPEFEGLHPPAGILFRKYMNLPAQNGAFSEIEVERFWAQKLKDVIRDNPSAVGFNFLRRLVIFFNAREWSQEFDVYAYRNYSRFLSLPWTGFWLIGPLGFIGLFLNRRITQNQALLIIVTIAVIVSIIPFKVSDRYRLPAAFLLTMFAALALRYFYLWIKSGNKRALYMGLPVCAVLCLICWPDWQNLAGRKTARHYFFVGKHYEESGRLDDAIHAYLNSMTEFPWDPDSPYRIGRILARQGQHELALKYFKEALQQEPQFPGVLNEIARYHLGNGDLETAEQQLVASLRLAPAKVDTLMLMADLQRRRGDTRGEFTHLKNAVMKTGNHRPAMLLAARLNELGNHEDAIGLYTFVMRSRQVDKLVRVTSALLAGLLTARFLDGAADTETYWDYIVDEFDDFRFFSLQAKFLKGSLSEETFREQMGPSLDWMVAAEYVIGLNHWLNGDVSSAIQAFENCLNLDNGKPSRNPYLPQTWAREDLKRVRNTRNRRGDRQK